MLVGMILGLKIAAESWAAFAEATVAGNRIGALMALTQAVDAVSTISPALAGWLNQTRTAINNAPYVERHALYGVLGRALADGWEHFDRGRLGDAERLGKQAYEIARSDRERFAARRLRDFAEIVRDWVERNGVSDANRTQTVLTKIELLYQPDEIAARDNFAGQMPSKDTFLRAMNKGLTDQFARESTAALRLLFMNYILLGVLDAHDDKLDDALFWRDAAVKTLGDLGVKHPTTHTLEEYVQRRRDLAAAAGLINSINGIHALPTLESSRRALEQNPQAKTLAPALFSLRELEAATRDWSDGEFRAAGTKLENAIRSVDEIETAAGVTLTAYRAFLMGLLTAGAELYANARRTAQVIDSKPEAPNDLVLQTHRHQVEVTTRLLGAAYAGNLRLWQETYEQFLAVYADQTLRRSAKLTRFNDLFRAMFIDRHPAYPLYRHWYNLTEQSPEFPPPPTTEPTPRITEGDAEVDEFRPFVRIESPDAPDDDDDDDDEPPRRRISSGVIVLAVGGLLLLILVAVVLISGGIGGSATPTPASAAGAVTPEAIAAAFTDEPTDPSTALPTTAAPVVLATVPVRGTETVTPTSTPSNTPPPSATPTLTPTLTWTPSATWTPSSTPPPTNTPMPTVPAGGLHGEQNLLRLVNGAAFPTWRTDAFVSGQDGDYWRLGIGSEVPDASVIEIALPPPLLESIYGADAASRIISIDAELELITFNPPLLIDNQVYFGLMLEPVSDPTQAVGAQIQVPEAGVFNIGQRTGSNVTTNMQRSVGAQVARIRLVRDLSANTIAVFVNNEQVGTTLSFVSGETQVMPVLYIREGGVIVHVNSWRLTLR